MTNPQFGNAKAREQAVRARVKVEQNRVDPGKYRVVIDSFIVRDHMDEPAANQFCFSLQQAIIGGIANDVDTLTKNEAIATVNAIFSKPNPTAKSITDAIKAL